MKIHKFEDTENVPTQILGDNPRRVPIRNQRSTKLQEIASAYKEKAPIKYISAIAKAINFHE